MINIQDLGLSTANQHSVGGQPILRVIFRFFLFSESFSGYRWAADTLNESPKSFKKYKNKHFVDN
jgi:hypothetical protein